MKFFSFSLAVIVMVIACAVAWGIHRRGGVKAPIAVTRQTPIPQAASNGVTIRRPAGSPVAHGANPQSGAPVTVACTTCHATRPPNSDNRTTADLDLFHQGLQVEHGSNTCLSCHNPQDYGTLHLANGRKVEFTDVVTLCSQCHGPQWRDFQHGAHGGMNGSWDLSRGPRERNGCTSCHDPHAPRFRGAHPVLPPRDRFLEAPHE